MAKLVVIGVVAISCGAEPPVETAPERHAAPPLDLQPRPRPRCRAPAGVSASPGSIADVVTLVNALPRPLELTCFLESLDRPLRVEATSSVISLQPAAGARSPRIFLLSERLISSVVPAGDGSPLVEFGEFVDQERTLKAEIAFPLTGLLDPAVPYRKVRDGSGTTCRGCHRNEERFEAIGFAEAFVSAALRPSPRSRVDLESVRQQHRTCDELAEPARCAFFEALFDHGDVLPGTFPPSLPTIFD